MVRAVIVYKHTALLHCKASKRSLYMKRLAKRILSLR